MGKFIRHTNVDEAKVIQVIQVKSIVGEGTPGDPVYQLTEYFSLDGELLARQGTGELTVGHWKGGEDMEQVNASLRSKFRSTSFRYPDESLNTESKEQPTVRKSRTAEEGDSDE